MSDRLHTHLEIGFRPDCPACDQTAEQLQVEAGLIDSNPAGAPTTADLALCV